MHHRRVLRGVQIAVILAKMVFLPHARIDGGFRAVSQRRFAELSPTCGAMTSVAIAGHGAGRGRRYLYN